MDFAINAVLHYIRREEEENVEYDRVMLDILKMKVYLHNLRSIWSTFQIGTELLQYIIQYNYVYFKMFCLLCEAVCKILAF